MIAFSDDLNAQGGGETGGNLFVECCEVDSNGEEGECTSESGGGTFNFPTQTCGFLGLAFGMYSSLLAFKVTNLCTQKDPTNTFFLNSLPS